MYRENGGPANVIQCQPAAANERASNRYVLNIQVFACCYEVSLNETIAIFCADLMCTCNRGLCHSAALFENFQHKIRTIYDKRTYVSEWCKDVWYWTENANEMIFGVPVY